MKLTVIELDYHGEVLYNFSYLLNYSKVETDIYTLEEIYQEIEKNIKDFKYINWIVLGNKKKKNNFILDNLSKINKSDIVFFNTLASSYKLFCSLHFKPIVVLRIHNVNCNLALSNKYKPKLSPYFIYKDISHIVRLSLGKLDWYYRRKFIEDKVDYLCFADSSILQYYERMINFNFKDKKRFFLPLTSYRGSLTRLSEVSSSQVSICIPGTIDRRRRNYIIVYKALLKGIPKFKKKIVFNLLGKPKDKYGRRVISLFKNMISDQFELVTFKDRIPQDEFIQIISGADFFVIPVLSETRYTIYNEYYGKTKISGNINDMISYAKPSIISSSYILNETLEKITESFKNVDELSTLIIDWVNHGTYKKLPVNEVLKEYSDEQLSKYLIEIFNKLQASL